MSNSIIKNFKLSGDFIKKSNEFLYTRIIINKKNAKSLNVKYFKVCILRTSNLSDENFNIPGYSSAYEKMLSRNNKNKINQSVFKDEPIIFDNSDLSFQEITTAIDLSIVKNNLIDLVGPSGPMQFEVEFPHTFKIYFLDDKKRIIENYTFNQEENIRLSNYNTERFDNVIENIFKNSIDIDFRNYNDDFSLGPVINYADSLNEFDDFDLDNVSIKINYLNKTYNIQDASDLSSVLINTYGESILLDLYKTINVQQNIDFVDIELVYSYKQLNVVKNKRISKSKIVNLYTSYFKKHTRNFISSIFQDKTSISRESNCFKLTFLSPDVSLIPGNILNSKIKISKTISGIKSNIDRLYTTKSLNKDFSILSSSKEFNFEIIYDDFENKNIRSYFIESERPFNTSVTVYFNDQTILQSNINSGVLIESEKLKFFTNNSFKQTNSFKIKDMMLELNNVNADIVKTPQSLLFNFINEKITGNFSLSGSSFTCKINETEILNRKSYFDKFDYNLENNDYLVNEVIDNTIVCYKISYKTENLNHESILFKKLSSLFLNNQINIPVSDLPSRTDVKLEIQTITFPNKLLNLLNDKSSSSDDTKEKLASFLNNLCSNKFHKINNLIQNYLFENSKGISENVIYQKIFSTINRPEFITYIINTNGIQESISNENNFNETEINTPIVVPRVKNEILEISKFDSSSKIFKSRSLFTISNKSIKLYSFNKDNVIGVFSLENILNSIETDISNLSFNISYLLTFNFDKNSFNSRNAENRKIFSESIVIEEGTYFLYKNLDFIVRENNIIIKSPFEKNYLEYNEDAYDIFEKVWGRNNELWVLGLLERFTISINNENRHVQTVSINNYVKKDYSLKESKSEKIYVLNRNLHMPNIKVEFK